MQKVLTYYCAENLTPKYMPCVYVREGMWCDVACRVDLCKWLAISDDEGQQKRYIRRNDLSHISQIWTSLSFFFLSIFYFDFKHKNSYLLTFTSWTCMDIGRFSFSSFLWVNLIFFLNHYFSFWTTLVVDNKNNLCWYSKVRAFKLLFVVEHFGIRNLAHI